MKSYATRCALVLVLFLVLAASVSNAVPRRGLTLLVVPSRYSVMQVAFDIVHRYGTALVTYEGDASSQNPDLFAWNGTEWVKISLQDYADCTFMQAAPSRTILVGGDDVLPPLMADYAEGWSLETFIIPSVHTADLVNSFANMFSFRKHDWAWFTQRYNLDLEDLNSARRKQSWYDRRQYDDKWAHRWSWLRRKDQPLRTEDIEPLESAEVQPDFVTVPSSTDGEELLEETSVSVATEPEAIYEESPSEAGDVTGETDIMTEDNLPPPFEETNAATDSSSVENEVLPEPLPVTGDMMNPAVQEDVNYEAVEETYPVK